MLPFLHNTFKKLMTFCFGILPEFLQVMDIFQATFLKGFNLVVGRREAYDVVDGVMREMRFMAAEHIDR